MNRLCFLKFGGDGARGVIELGDVVGRPEGMNLRGLLADQKTELANLSAQMPGLLTAQSQLRTDVDELDGALVILREHEVPGLQTDVNGLKSEAETLAASLASLREEDLAAIKTGLDNLKTAFDLFISGEKDGGEIDRLAELVAAIRANRDSIDTLVAAMATREALEALASRVAPLEKTASGSADGLMSAADKLKLDGIAAGATNTGAPPAAADAAPKAHGTAAVGTSAKYAREDHVHPSDNMDTHWVTHLYVGTAAGAANAATTNGNTYLLCLDNSTVRDRKLIKGAGSVSVSSDANGNITIQGTDTNTTYGPMTGAAATTNGAAGLVPAPAAGAANRYLRSDGSWQVPPNSTYTLAALGGVPISGARGALAGYETPQDLSNSQTISVNSRDCVNLATSGAVTLTFTPAAATISAVKVICLKASAATTLTVKNAVWANNGSAPAWGAAGKILVLVALFAGARVVLSVADNTQ